MYIDKKVYGGIKYIRAIKKGAPLRGEILKPL